MAGFNKDKKHGKVKTGVDPYKEPLDRADGLLQEEIEWARELGAKTDGEAVELVSEHKQDYGA